MNSANRLIESRAILSLLGNKIVKEIGDNEVILRLQLHAQRVLETRQNPSVDNLLHLLLRKHYVLYGSAIDDEITRSLRDHFIRVDSNPFEFQSETNKAFSTDVCQKLFDEGYYIFPHPLHESTVSSLQAEFYQNFVTSEVLGRQIFPIYDFSNFATIQRIITDPILLNIVYSYFGSPPVFDGALFSRSTPNPVFPDGDPKDAQLYHYDKDRISFLKVFFYLSDVCESSGPHEYIPRYRTKDISHFRLDQRTEDKNILANFGFNPSKIITGRRGTFFIGDTHALHKGNPVKYGDRLILQLQFANSVVGKAEPSLSINKIPKVDSLSSTLSEDRFFARFVRQ